MAAEPGVYMLVSGASVYLGGWVMVGKGKGKGQGQVLLGASSNVELEQTFLRLLLGFIGTVYGVTINYLGVLGDAYLTPVVALGYFYVVY